MIVRLFYLSSLFPLVSTFSIHSHAVRSPRTVLSATWSDSKAVKDYQDFLSSGRQEVERKKDCPSVIIHDPTWSTEMSEALVAMGDGQDMVLTPNLPLPEADREYPIYIALPPWLIEPFLMNLGDSYKERIEDFCFLSGGLQYGNIEDVLKERGYCRDSMTQFLVSGMRIPPTRKVQDLHVVLGMSEGGETKYAGECAACGKWAGAIAERLERNDVRCSVNFYRDWRRKMWEQNVHDAAFQLIGAVRDDTTVNDVAKFYEHEVSDMVWELSQLLRGWKALTLMYGFEERIFGVAESKAGEVTAIINEQMYPFIWGNNVYLQSQPYVEYLNIAQERGLLPNVQLPQRAADEYSTKMRQGNLRADGAI